MYDRTRDNSFKLKEERFRLDTRKIFFYNEGDQILPQVMDASSLEIFIVRLDRALSILIYLKMSLLTAGGLRL